MAGITYWGLAHSCGVLYIPSPSAMRAMRDPPITPNQFCWSKGGEWESNFIATRFLHACRRSSTYLTSTDSCLHVENCVVNKIPRHYTDSQNLADITECRRCVGPTFLTCRQQTKMSVVWVVEQTDTNPTLPAKNASDFHWLSRSYIYLLVRSLGPHSDPMRGLP